MEVPAVKKCLLVDDDPRVVDLLNTYLSGQAECQTAACGADAVAVFAQALENKAGFEVVFMDILMPDMDGHAAVKAMRDREAAMGIVGPAEFRLVMITSSADVKDVTRAFFRRYASCYLVKPFTRQMVLDALAAKPLRDSGE